MDEEREMVLRMLKEGKITVEEADALLQELVEQQPDGESGAAPPPPPSVPSVPDISDARDELRSVFQDLMQSIPRDVVREIKEAKEALRPGFFQVVRGLRGLAEGRAETTAEEAMSPGDQIVLSNAWGDVTLTASPDGRAQLRAVKRVWAEAAEEAQREAEALTVEIHRHGTRLEVSVPRPLRRHQRSRVDFQVAVPRDVDVRVDVAKGDVGADALRGKIDLRIAHGDVKIRRQEGAVNLDVASGDIHLAGVQGDVRLDVRSGDITARDVGGALRGRIVRGDVTVQGVGALSLDVIHGDVTAIRTSGAVDVETKSGDVSLADGLVREVRVRTLAGDVEVSVEELGEGPVTVETMSGDIKLGLSPTARATIDATTRSGSVHSALPLQQTSGDRRSLYGILNGPGVTIRLSATTGDIEVRERRP